MSGGVDSSVSAALLKQAGFDVTGVFINVWQPDFIECSMAADRLEAMRAAAHLGIPFQTLDLENEYKREVVDYMLAEYRAGRTPNPDVMCNRHIKFGSFFDWALREGADYVATGHYARSKSEGSRHMLLAGRDQQKDQSYFLWTLTSEKLSKIIFPVGDMEKSEVRELASKFGLPNATRKDSQGLCMVGDLDMKAFLAHFLEEKEGDVLSETGEKIGTHPGSWFFTIGERHGFTITKKTPNDKPLYVISKDVKKNTITVGTEEVKETSPSKIMTIQNCNWILRPEEGRGYSARARYRQKLLPCHVSLNGEVAEIQFESAPEAPAPGQSLVVYDGDVCLGGGIIA